jgi:hypothetical protein
MEQHVPPVTQEYFRGFFIENFVIINGQGLFLPEGPGGVRGYRGLTARSAVKASQHEVLLRPQPYDAKRRLGYAEQARGFPLLGSLLLRIL